MKYKIRMKYVFWMELNYHEFLYDIEKVNHYWNFIPIPNRYTFVIKYRILTTE